MGAVTKQYRPRVPEQSYLLPPSPMDWLPEGTWPTSCWSWVAAEWAIVCLCHNMLKLRRTLGVLRLSAVAA